MLAPLCAPTAAQALDFASTPSDQSYAVGVAVDVTLPATQIVGLCNGTQVNYTLSPPPAGGPELQRRNAGDSGTPSTVTPTTEYTYSGRDTNCYETATAKFDITVAAAPDITLSGSARVSPRAAPTRPTRCG